MQAEEIERVHRQFCKFTLDVPKQQLTWHVMVILGRAPLLTQQMVKYWLTVAGCLDTPIPLLEMCTLWRKTTAHGQYSYVWTHPECVEPGKLIYEIEQQLIDQFVQ